MFGVVIATVLVAALLTLPLWIVMRIRLMRAETARDRIAWLQRRGSEVLDTYKVLYPGSYLPKICRAALWTIVASAVLLLGSLLVAKP